MARKYLLPLLISVIVTACSTTLQPTTPSNTKRIIYGLTFEPSGFDPHINSSAELGIPLRQVYDTLIYREPNSNKFVPGLATKWEISSDGLSYTFELRQNVTFHDGTPFNAQAVAANLDRITNPDNASQKAIFMLGSYSGYKIIDNYTIQLNLSTPYSPLLDSLSQVYLGIASPTALSTNSTSRYQFNQVGTGPYRFVEYIPGDRIVLKRNTEYTWGPSFYTPQTTDNSIDEIEFRFYTDPPTRSPAIEANQVQVIGELLPTDARALTGNSAIQLLPIPVPGQPLQFIFNTKLFPTDNLAVRQALIYGTNRNAIIDTVFQRFSPVAWGPLAANTLYYSRQVQGQYDFDTTQARDLLSAANYLDTNNDSYIELNGIDLTVKVIVPPWGLIPEVSQLIQDQWRTIGVRTDLEPVPTRSALIEKVNSGDYNLVAFYTFGVDPSFLNQFFLSNSSDNWSRFTSPDLDRILTEAVQQNDPSTRQSLYEQAQRIIMDNALILPIRDYVNLNAASASIQGLTFDAYGWFPILTNTYFTPPQ